MNNWTNAGELASSPIPSLPVYRDRRSISWREVSLDRVIRWYLIVLAAFGLVYVACTWTPSSYGAVFQTLNTPAAGPIAGTSRFVRSDEWSIETPYFQAAVRNRFRRINETSFYREDLRNFYALPLADWSLFFKPQLWAFFVLPPASAYSIYWAIFLVGFLAGYPLLFREIGAPSWLSIGAGLTLFFTGFVQFWWTTFAPLLAGFPWIVLLLLRPMTPWLKGLVCAWAFAAFVLSHAYPTLIITLVWAALILIAAFRPAVGRSRGEVAAVVVAAVVAMAIVYGYYADVIPIMRNTVYPGHRVSPSGGTSLLAGLSELLPTVSFSLNDYQSLTAENICEIGAVGSFLPILILCLFRYRGLRKSSMALRLLMAAFAAITIYQFVPLPDWVGKVLLWNTGSTNRWLFTSGLLLIVASIVVLNEKLVSLHPLRFTLFAMIAPAAAILCKTGPVSEDEIVLCGLLFVAGLSAWYIPAEKRAAIVLAVIALVNIYAFGRFNPLQSARPIFGIPDSDAMRTLRAEATASPGGVLIEPQIVGAVLNGLGFRSVNHALLAPRLDVFRRYFPTMDAQRFNEIFNRYAYVVLSTKPMPAFVGQVLIQVPIEPFVPVRNVRKVILSDAPKACADPTRGTVEKISTDGASLTLEGWAPWMSETDAQGIRVSSVRPLSGSSLTTITRPDIAEKLQDYRIVKAGFRLRLTASDGKPLRREDVALVAFGTVRGDVCF